MARMIAALALVACSRALVVQKTASGCRGRAVRAVAISREADVAALEAALADPLGATDEAAKRAKRLEAAEIPLDVFVIGLSHHNAGVEVREKLAVPEAEWEAVAAAIVESSDGAVAEAAVLSTCNRFEVYFAARDSRSAFAAATKYLQERSGIAMSTLRESLFMLSYDDASTHAFRVSAGLDSLIVGEGQILSQMKACYAHAIAEESGGGKIMSRLLNDAVAAGKRVRSETGISKGAVSISSAAYELANERAQGDLAGLALTPDARVLIIGAGTMTRLLLTHMAAHGLTKCVLLNRSEPKAAELAVQFAASHGIEIEVVATGGDPEAVWPYLTNADVCFAASSSDTYLIDKAGLAPRLSERAPGRKKLMLVDICVPRNIDPEVADLPDVKVYDVDSLKAVVERNTAKRRREIIEAEKLLASDGAQFRGWISTLAAVPAITQLQNKAEELRLQEMRRANAKLASLSQKELEAVERLSRGIVSKLLHGPMASVRDANGDADQKKTALTLLKQMFKL